MFPRCLLLLPNPRPQRFDFLEFYLHPPQRDDCVLERKLTALDLAEPLHLVYESGKNVFHISEGVVRQVREVLSPASMLQEEQNMVEIGASANKPVGFVLLLRRRVFRRRNNLWELRVATAECVVEYPEEVLRSDIQREFGVVEEVPVSGRFD